MSKFEIRRLGIVDIADYRSIRLAALQGEPEAFGSVYEVEAARPPSAFAERLAISIIFAAYAGGNIVGMAGLKQETGLKDCHKGFVWGMYVRPHARGQGIGAALLAAIIACAEQIVEQLTLTVVQGNGAALSLYRKSGFQVYGVEPRALKTAGGYSDEILMSRFL